MNDDVEKLTQSVSVKEILEYQLFSLGKFSLTVYEVIGAFVIIILGIIISKILKKIIYKSNKIDLGKKFAFYKIFHYVIIVIVVFLTMKTLGVNVSPLLLGSGAILVGVGLGLQNLFLDIISGIIILFDRTIQVGDIIDVDGMIGEVQEIKIRTSTILTRENKNIVFPNSVLTKNRLINFSFSDDMVIFEISVGVDYATDLDLAEQLMKEAALSHEGVLKEPAPLVRLESFGPSSIELKLLYSSNHLFRQPVIRSDIRKHILKMFKDQKITIPYPITTLNIPNKLE